MATFLAVAATTSARRGEVLALRWSDTQEGRATPTRSLRQTRQVLKFKDTKTERRRGLCTGSVQVSLSTGTNCGEGLWQSADTTHFRIVTPEPGRRLVHASPNHPNMCTLHDVGPNGSGAAAGTSGERLWTGSRSGRTKEIARPGSSSYQ